MSLQTEKLSEEWNKYSQRSEIEDVHVIECIDDALNFFLSKRTELLAEIREKIEKVDVSGGGSGRRLKMQILEDLSILQ
jgi:hypothetical protein